MLPLDSAVTNAKILSFCYLLQLDLHQMIGNDFQLRSRFFQIHFQMACNTSLSVGPHAIRPDTNSNQTLPILKSKLYSFWKC